MGETEDLEALRRLDEEAFAPLVQKHHRQMIRIASIYVSTRASAEEVAQETWMAVLREIKIFSDYLEGALSPEMSGICEEHLRSCSPCMTYLSQLKLTIQSLRALAGNGLPVDVKEMLLDQFREFKRE